MAGSQSTNDDKSNQAKPEIRSYSFLHLAMSFFFLFSAYLNLNDPDPVYWICIYGFGAIVSFLAFFNASIPAIVPGLSSLICIAQIVHLSLHLSQTYQFQSTNSVWEFFETEEGREIGGLAILSFEMAFIALALLNKQNNDNNNRNQKRKQVANQNNSMVFTFLYWCGVLLVVSAFYAAVFLQPEMNKRLAVEHCSGTFPTTSSSSTILGDKKN